MGCFRLILAIAVLLAQAREAFPNSAATSSLKRESFHIFV